MLDEVDVNEEGKVEYKGISIIRKRINNILDVVAFISETLEIEQLTSHIASDTLISPSKKVNFVVFLQKIHENFSEKRFLYSEGLADRESQDRYYSGSCMENIFGKDCEFFGRKGK